MGVARRSLRAQLAGSAAYLIGGAIGAVVAGATADRAVVGGATADRINYWGYMTLNYFAPDAEQEWVWITPGAVLAAVLRDLEKGT